MNITVFYQFSSGSNKLKNFIFKNRMIEFCKGIILIYGNEILDLIIAAW